MIRRVLLFLMQKTADLSVSLQLKTNSIYSTYTVYMYISISDELQEVVGYDYFLIFLNNFHKAV